MAFCRSPATFATRNVARLFGLVNGAKSPRLVGIIDPSGANKPAQERCSLGVDPNRSERCKADGRTCSFETLPLAENPDTRPCKLPRSKTRASNRTSPLPGVPLNVMNPIPANHPHPSDLVSPGEHSSAHQPITRSDKIENPDEGTLTSALPDRGESPLQSGPGSS
jgi:hypothetical protein